MRPKRQRQLEIDFKSHGGRRPGAGRPRLHHVPGLKGPGVPHRPRPPIGKPTPLHVTLRFRGDLPRLRNGKAFAIVKRALANARERLGLRLVHFSVQSNHIHLIVEAGDHTALSRGVRGLAIRLARALNRVWRRRGPVFADRYHARALRTPREVRNALCYVLNNARRHGLRLGMREIDYYSSGVWFGGWRDARPRASAGEDPPVSPARTWLLREGWRRHGLLGLAEVPGPS